MKQEIGQFYGGRRHGGSWTYGPGGVLLGGPLKDIAAQEADQAGLPPPEQGDPAAPPPDPADPHGQGGGHGG